jgi:hypothetical protein
MMFLLTRMDIVWALARAAAERAVKTMEKRIVIRDYW